MSKSDEQSSKAKPDVEERELAVPSNESDTPDVEGHMKVGHHAKNRAAKNRAAKNRAAKNRA